MDNEEKSTCEKIEALKEQKGLAVVEKSYDVLDAMQDFAIRVARDEKATPASSRRSRESPAMSWCSASPAH